MIKASELDLHSLDHISTVFRLAKLHFDVDTSSVREQRKCLRFIKDHTTLISSVIDKRAISFLFHEADTEATIAFIKECAHLSKQHREKKKAEFIKNSPGLSAEVTDAMLSYFTQDLYAPLFYHGRDIIISLEGGVSYRRLLILKNSGGTHLDMDNHSFGHHSISIEFKDGLYRLGGTIRNITDDTVSPFEITFTDAVIDVSVYNCIDCLAYCEKAWDYFFVPAVEIVDKAIFSENHCNKDELELLPLLKEVCTISPFMDLIEDDCKQFPLLKSHAEKFGCRSFAALLKKLEKAKPDTRRYKGICKQLERSLCKSENAPMAMALFERMEKSQAEYPHSSDALSPNEMEKARSVIQKRMEHHGFQGTYPHYTAKSDKASFLIHCFEYCLYSSPFITFFCCTSLVKNDEKADDVYSFLFDNSCKRMLRTVSHYVPCEYDGISEDSESTEDQVDIAVNKVRTLHGVYRG